VLDVFQPYHGLDSHGIYLDWIANSRLHIWFVLSPIVYVLYLTSKGGIPPYIYGDIGGVDRYGPHYEVRIYCTDNV
jgi:hypothetical protein